MPKPTDFAGTVRERLAPLGLVSARDMFGGWGIYVDGQCCTIVHREVPYLKADETSRAQFETKGSLPIKPLPDKPTVISYYEVRRRVLRGRSGNARMGPQGPGRRAAP